MTQNAVRSFSTLSCGATRGTAHRRRQCSAPKRAVGRPPEPGTHLVLNHQRQAQRVGARVLQRHAHHAGRVANHEGHRLRRHRISRADEVALVLSVFVVHHHHELPRSNRRKRLRNRGETRRGLVRIQRLRRLRVPGSHSSRHSAQQCTPAACSPRTASQRRHRRRAAAQRRGGGRVRATRGGTRERHAARRATRNALRGRSAARCTLQRVHGAQRSLRRCNAAEDWRAESGGRTARRTTADATQRHDSLALSFLRHEAAAHARPRVAAGPRGVGSRRWCLPVLVRRWANAEVALYLQGAAAQRAAAGACSSAPPAARGVAFVVRGAQRWWVVTCVRSCESMCTFRCVAAAHAPRVWFRTGGASPSTWWSRPWL